MNLEELRPLPYPSRLDPVPLSGGCLELWRPRDPEEVLNRLVDAPVDPDDKMPYWSDLWPSAVGLAEAIDAGRIPVAGRRVLELGCGLGLCSLVAARRGASSVRATDWDREALQYVAASAEHLGLPVSTGLLDWRQAPPDPEADIILAADVLYEARNLPWLTTLTHNWCPLGACHQRTTRGPKSPESPGAREPGVDPKFSPARGRGSNGKVEASRPGSVG